MKNEFRQSELQVLMFLNKKTARTRDIAVALGYDTTTISDAMVVLRKKGFATSRKLKSVKTGFPALTHSITTKGRNHIKNNQFVWRKVETSSKRKKKVISKTKK